MGKVRRKLNSRLLKNSSHRKSKKRNMGIKKDSRLLIQTYISIIMLILSFAVANVNTPFFNGLQKSLKKAVISSISLDEAKRALNDGLSKIGEAKTTALEKIGSDAAMPEAEENISKDIITDDSTVNGADALPRQASEPPDFE